MGDFSREVLAILKEGSKCFHLLKEGRHTFLSCLDGGCKKFRTHDFPIL